MKLIQQALMLPVLLVSVYCSATPPVSLDELEKSGTLLQLNGRFEAVAAVEDVLLNQFEQPAGHIFALNTIVTLLTWDEAITDYDLALQEHAATTLDWCTNRLESNRADALANYYCGQAHFALSYFNGVRGNYYKAGRHGTECIEYLEQALAADPGLVDAKMHLGVAYFVADNLPPFIRMFSRLLWFIPTGNSEKSLPYVRDVMTDGDLYRDVARYIYSFLLLEKGPDSWPEAQQELTTLVESYPGNHRFQLRLISLLLIREQFEDTLVAANRYLDSAYAPDEPEASLVRIWMVRAYLGTGNLPAARSLFDKIDPLLRDSVHELPDWSSSWHLLTRAQLQDLTAERRGALDTYRQIISTAGKTYVNPMIIDAARAGLIAPYRMPTP